MTCSNIYVDAQKNRLTTWILSKAQFAGLPRGTFKRIFQNSHIYYSYSNIIHQLTRAMVPFPCPQKPVCFKYCRYQCRSFEGVHVTGRIRQVSPSNSQVINNSITSLITYCVMDFPNVGVLNTLELTYTLYIIDLRVYSNHKTHYHAGQYRYTMDMT